MKSFKIKELLSFYSKKHICLCAAIRPFMVLSQICGMLPITVVHNDGQCVFQKSKLWICWSIVVVTSLIVHLCVNTDLLILFKMEKDISLHGILRSIVTTIYCIYIIILAVLNNFKMPKFVKTLNKIQATLKDGLLCQSSLKVLLFVQGAYIGVTALGVVLQTLALFYLQISGSYETNFTFKIYTSELLQNLTFVFCTIFLCNCAIFMGLLACFEKMTIYVLKFGPVHPTEGFYETNNCNNFFGLFEYKLCNSEHACNELVRNYKPHEVMEYLRCLHEHICVLMGDSNVSLNPQLLCHMVVELTVLIVNYYAVVIYFVYDFKTPLSSTFHFLNCLFVIMHTLGLLIFLRNSQRLQNMIKGMVTILLEYSTRLTTPEEHQQMRLFIAKLEQQRPMNASGVVNIDLSIGGPICANILTYVLVALQFEVPKT